MGQLQSFPRPGGLVSMTSWAGHMAQLCYAGAALAVFSCCWRGRAAGLAAVQHNTKVASYPKASRCAGCRCSKFCRLTFYPNAINILIVCYPVAFSFLLLLFQPRSCKSRPGSGSPGHVPNNPSIQYLGYGELCYYFRQSSIYHYPRCWIEWCTSGPLCLQADPLVLISKGRNFAKSPNFDWLKSGNIVSVSPHTQWPRPYLSRQGHDRCVAHKDLRSQSRALYKFESWNNSWKICAGRHQVCMMSSKLKRRVYATY